ncbi:MAG TPA: hypothetical protein DIT25_01955, partial [Candidatus Moranbacteria bacterium]|nr:hypothetical protein [Candidatus Moranbacteria bacterium]
MSTRGVADIFRPEIDVTALKIAKSLAISASVGLLENSENFNRDLVKKICIGSIDLVDVIILHRLMGPEVGLLTEEMEKTAESGCLTPEQQRMARLIGA